MIKSVVIDGDNYKIKQSDVLGTGGEATVVKVAKWAVKLYHPQMAATRIEKVKDFVARSIQLPKNVCSPLKIATDSKRKPVGFAMVPLSGRTEVVQMLASKGYRKSNPQFNSKFITDLFILMHRTTQDIHQSGVIIGDYNDMNVLFNRKGVPFFIDADSFQFHNHPCMVGTENFLPPELYNINLGDKCYFEENHDWYGFFCMFIRSILLAHPYGGVCKGYNSIMQRAMAKITVLDSAVKYPKPAFNPEILSGDVIETFERMFARGERFKPEQALLEDFRDGLIECNSCGTFFSGERKNCPQCSTINTQQVQRKVKVVKSPGKRTVNCETLLETQGDFIWHKVHGLSVYAIAIENGKYYFYHSRPNQKFPKKELFGVKSSVTKFDIVSGKYLIVSQDSLDSEILVLDISGTTPKGLTKTHTADFEFNRQFAGSNDHLIRIYGGILYRGKYKTDLNLFDEQNITAIMQNQTWMRASTNGNLMFVAERMFNEWRYSLWAFDKHKNGARYDVKIPELEFNESIIDYNVVFDSSSLLLMLKTIISGKTYTRVYVIHQDQGKILTQYRVESLQSDTYRSIYGKAFGKPHNTNGFIFHPTDDGIVQEIVGQKQTLITETEQFVSENDSLAIYDKGIIVSGDKTVNYLTIS